MTKQSHDNMMETVGGSLTLGNTEHYMSIAQMFETAWGIFYWDLNYRNTCPDKYHGVAMIHRGKLMLNIQ